MLLVVLALGPAPRLSGFGVAAVLGVSLLLALSFASLAWAQSRDSAWTSANKLAMYAVVLGIGLAAIRTRPTARAVMFVLGLPALVSALVLAVEFVIGTGSGAVLEGRLQSPMGYINGTAGMLVTGVWPWLGIAERARDRRVRACRDRGSVADRQHRPPHPVARDRAGNRGVAAPGPGGGAGAHAPWRQPADRAVLGGCRRALDAGRLQLDRVAATAGAGRRNAARRRPRHARSRRARRRAEGVGRPCRQPHPRASTHAVQSLPGEGTGWPRRSSWSLPAFAAEHGRIATQWRDFTSLNAEQASSNRFLALGGGFRDDLWRVAVDEFAAHPLGGVGAGNYVSEY